ncbi:MAG: hypothetical protein ACOCRX_07115 [Candidatus Woesearchaeota archaeon]
MFNKLPPINERVANFYRKFAEDPTFDTKTKEFLNKLADEAMSSE